VCVCVCAWVRGPSHHLPPKTPENSDLIVTGCVPVSTTVVRCVSHTKGILPRGCDVVRDYARDDAVTSSTVTPSPPPPPPLSLVSPGLVVLSFYSFFFFAFFFLGKVTGIEIECVRGWFLRFLRENRHFCFPCTVSQPMPTKDRESRAAACVVILSLREQRTTSPWTVAVNKKKEGRCGFKHVSPTLGIFGRGRRDSHSAECAVAAVKPRG